MCACDIYTWEKCTDGNRERKEESSVTGNDYQDRMRSPNEQVC